MSDICEKCGKPDASEAVAAQQEALRPRHFPPSRVLVTKSDAFSAILQYEQPDVRLGDIVEIRLIAGAVPDVTADFYCECQ